MNNQEIYDEVEEVIFSLQSILSVLRRLLSKLSV